MIISHGQLVASDSPEGLQKLMSGTPELLLTVKGDYEAVKDALAGAADVDIVENLGETEEHCVKIRITAKENADIREDVFYVLAAAKLPILEMNKEQKSLEDIFLELTSSTGEEEKAPRRWRGKKRKADNEPADAAETADVEQAAEESESAEAASGEKSGEETKEEVKEDAGNL